MTGRITAQYGLIYQARRFIKASAANANELPPSLLIENASGLTSRLAYNYLAEAFPIKASDLSELGKVLLVPEERLCALLAPLTLPPGCR